MPRTNRPLKRQRTIRVEDEVWEAAQAQAKEDKRDLAEVIRSSLVRYARAKLPKQAPDTHDE